MRIEMGFMAVKPLFLPQRDRNFEQLAEGLAAAHVLAQDRLLEGVPSARLESLQETLDGTNTKWLVEGPRKGRPRLVPSPAGLCARLAVRRLRGQRFSDAAAG